MADEGVLPLTDGRDVITVENRPLRDRGIENWWTSAAKKESERQFALEKWEDAQFKYLNVTQSLSCGNSSINDGDDWQSGELG